MRNTRGQVSIEYTAVLASLLIILVLLIIIFNGAYVQQTIYTQYVGAAHTASLIGTFSKIQWAQGEGASHYQMVDISDSVKLDNSSIGNSSLKLYVSLFGDAFDFEAFNLSGWWPNNTGSVVMAMRNNGTHILIRPAALVSISKKGFYFTASGNDNVTITNSANESFVISEDLIFPACASCTYTTEGTNTLASGESRVGRVNIASLSSGIYSGYLQINATPLDSGSQFENITFNLPITVVRP